MKFRILMIVGLFILVSFALLGVSYVQSQIMDSVRSYVRGEGLWAKGQKDAVLHLQNYARKKNDSDYQLFMKALVAPLGDHQARIALQVEHPDLDDAYQGFIIGQNHPDDIKGMIQFFLYFQKLPYVRDAISYWTEGDLLIEQLQKIGVKINLAIKKNDLDEITLLLDELEVLNKKLADLEYNFSAVLSEGARWAKRLLLEISLGILIVMLIIVWWISKFILRDIEKTEHELLISQNRFKSLYHSNMIGIIDWHADGTIYDANDAFLNLLGYKLDSILSKKLNWRDLTPEEGHARDTQALMEIVKTGVCTPFEKDFVRSDGKRVPVFVGAALLGGESQKGICFVIDHTEIKQAHIELQLSATVFNASYDGIMIMDKNMMSINVNAAFCKMLACQRDELLKTNENILKRILPEDVYKQITVAMQVSENWLGDVSVVRKNNTLLPARLSINPVFDQQLNISHYVVIFTDISEHKAAENQLRQLAHYDFLTGLSNRSLFNEFLKNAIQRAKRSSLIFAVLFIDLDHFKPINDKYGHDIGDKLLQEIAARFQVSVRGNDKIARLGGDEFVILMEDIAEPQYAGMVAQKLNEVISEPCYINGLELTVSSSIGISLYPQDGDDVTSVLRSADTAMYTAKSSGRNKFYYFNPEQKSD